ncbi:MAG: hypothetical protein ACF8MF_00915 [Phycisphaerales bacterium JB052]
MVRPNAQTEHSTFSNEAVICVRQAQAAVSDLLTGAGLGGARPTEVGRILGVDKTLAWKMSRFSESADLIKAVKHIPGPGGVEIMLKAAQDAGVGKERIDAVRRADQAFREFVRQRAGDRRSFEAMLAAGGHDERIELEERKAYYQSGSAIWGVRARMQMLTLCLRPSTTMPDRIDVLQLSGFLDFERLRADVPWIIRRLWTSDTESKGDTNFKRSPLCPEAATGNALPLVPEFCTQPLPDINQFKGNNGVIYDEIAPGAVGKHGSVTCITGELYTGAIPLHRSPDNTFGRYELVLRTPVESVLFDIYLHEDLSHFSDFKYSVFGLLEDRPGVGVGKSHDRPIMPPQDAMRLGQPAIMQSNRFGEQPRLVEYALGRAGWESIDAFRGYRSELEYPATPWCLTMQCDIAQS